MRLLISPLSLLVLLFSTALSYSQGSSDDFLYNKIGTLRGRVTLVYQKDGRHVPANGNYFLIQRKDCRKSVIGVRTDKNGDYEVYLAKGTYRIIKRYGEREGQMTDAIRKEQQRTVVVQGTSTIFDFEIEAPPDDQSGGAHSYQ